MNALLFDMDGVLADNSDFHVQAWTVYSRRFGREMTVDDIKRRLGFNNREYMSFVLGREPTEAEVSQSTVEKEALYRELYAKHLATPPGLIALLEAAKRCGVDCGVATSAPKDNVDFVLDGLRLRPYFKQVVDSGQVRHGKPNPEIYQVSARRLGIPPSRCLVFEDAIAGIQAGNAAGMRVIALTTSYPAEILAEHKPAAIISSFTDLAAPGPAADLLADLAGLRLTWPAPVASIR